MDNIPATLRKELLLINQLQLVTRTTIAGTFYGIALALFCLYIHSLVPRLQDESRKGRAKFILGYSIITMLCGLYVLVSNAWAAQDAYIEHGNYPGGPYIYWTTTFHTPVIAIGVACQEAVDILTSIIQIWRVWVVWSATAYAAFVIVLPMLCFLTFIGLKLRTLILETTLPVAEVIQQDGKTDPAGSAIEGATTILCTVLISLLLLFLHWRQRKLTGKTIGSAGYLSIVAMLIESYALESIWILIGAVLSHPVGIIFSQTKTYIEIIAYLLVQCRVASGKAYVSQRGQSSISSLHWNRSNHATMLSVESSETGSVNRRVSTGPGTSDTSQASSIA